MGFDGTSLIKDGWFMEKGKLWPGQAMSLEVDIVLHHSKSPFQDVLVFKSKTYGNVLVLDGIIQCTERDEFAYQEMIAHLPMFTHPKPEYVLVIGGGDGGVVREVLKHDSVKSVVLCEIDAVVIHTARTYFPSMSENLSDERVTIVTDDGAEYMRRHVDEFDVIITDSSDPIGPAETLFEPPFYRAMATALRAGGVVCTQGECMWLHADLIRPLLSSCQSIFSVVRYAYTMIPTYPSGQIGFVLCAKSDTCDFSNPSRVPHENVQANLRYYNQHIHKASFVLPEFAKRQLEG